jgi:hypothetical protein
MLGFGKKKKKDDIKAKPPIDEPSNGAGFTEEDKKVLADAGINPMDINAALESPSTTEEAYAKIMNKLTEGDKKVIDLLSDLTPQQIMQGALLDTEASIFKDDYLSQFMLLHRQLLVSKKREGRKEVIKLSGAIREQELKKNLITRIKMMGASGQQSGG